MKATQTYNLSVPVEQAARALVSEGYQLEADRIREGVVSNSFHLIEQQGEDLVFELRTVEHKRTLTGSLDKSGTLNAVTRSQWNAASRTLSWTYAGAESHRVKIAGSIRLEAAGGGSRMVNEVDITVNIPLIGNKLAKFVVKEVEKGHIASVPVLERHAQQA